MTKNAFRASVCGVTVLLCSGVSAEEPAPGRGDLSRVREAYRADIAQFCDNIRPGGSRIRDCLKAHAANLSGACKAAIEAARERLRQS